MLARNDWKTPYANGLPVADSSRPLDWSIAASYKLFGVSNWSARLPVALCILLLSFTVYFFGRSLFAWNAAGLYAALLVLAWPGTFLATRDLTAAPFLYLETAVVAWVSWHLLIVRPLALWPASAATLAAALSIFLTGRWPGSALPLSILLVCWVARLFVAPGERVRRLLLVWTVLAFVLTSQWIYSPANAAVLWLSVIAPLALVVGGWLANREAFSDSTLTVRIAAFAWVLGVGVAAIAIFFAIHGSVPFQLHANSFLLTASASRIPLLIFALAILVGLSGFWIFVRQKNLRIANCFLIGLLGGVCVAVQAALVIDSPCVSSQILAEAIRPELNPADLVVIDGSYSDASSLAFYIEHPLLIAGERSGDSEEVDIQHLWNGAARIFLWTRTDKPLAAPGESFVIARSGGREIVSNQPNAGGASF
jgi:4-amino-4-deoxy-L-arabinose transferase-like glycosyltransferase